MFTRLQPLLVIAVASIGAIAPALLGHGLLMFDARSRAEAENATIAAEMVNRAETAIANAIDVTARLSAAGLSDCNAFGLAAMRNELFRNYTIRSIGVLDGTDSFACSHYGRQENFGITNPVTVAEDISIVVVEASNLADRTLLVRRETHNGALLGVLLTPQAVAVDILPRVSRDHTVAELRFTDDTLIATIPSPASGDSRAVSPVDDAISSSACSSPYGFCVTVMSPFAVTWASYRNLQIVAALGSVLCAVLAMVGASLFQRRFASLDVRIRRALKSGAFEPHYQPIVDIRTGRIAGCEVLMRWRRPDGVLIPPSEFIDKAEATGLILPMTDQIMRRAAEELRDVCAANPEFRLAFNLVDSHFDSFKIVTTIETIFDRLAIPLHHVSVEVTERRPLKNVERARIVIRRLQSIGVKVALDDVGTGHSGLAHLQQLGVDTIKIDKFFIDVIAKDGSGSPFVESLVSIAHRLGMDVVAEGVETYDQLLYLRERGVQKAQGYLFGRPVPKSEFIALMERAAGPVIDEAARSDASVAGEARLRRGPAAVPATARPESSRTAVAS
ncbi:EAL domain-containing protein [Methylobrevis albus]|uniref:cyclic-guanylate-specific phosphodiesterase n=1 Tax=Methylobrevis albus TaxID=2793297 RepID=A0A931HZG6_9HYPH|nr:EAL domain-containing protein [Methylobrevis albus]MBH0236599.1 EAL domain-containing protein [Methylobrevis albus]